jgi:tRNA pseudouridine55 synthase
VLVDKPAGPTSHDVVRAVRRTFGVRAVGHTGTLDPFATGLLVLLLGRATRLARFVESEAKTYRATARLGEATDTEDNTGQVIGPVYDGAALDEATVRQAFEGMRGPHEQRPPAFSAKKVDGVRSYTLARQGAATLLRSVPVTVHGLEMLRYGWPEVEFRCTVSAGTYVRSLARDAGDALGIGAHLTTLRREAIGRLRVESAVALHQIAPGMRVLSPAEVVGHLPRVDLAELAGQAVRHGRAVPNGWSVHGTVAMLLDGALLAVGTADEDVIKPMVVLEGA